MANKNRTIKGLRTNDKQHTIDFSCYLCIREQLELDLDITIIDGIELKWRISCPGPYWFVLSFIEHGLGGHLYMILRLTKSFGIKIASQVILWLHEEAFMVGVKANRDYLYLSFELEQGQVLGLVAHVDPEDTQGCISWWLVMEDGFTEERKIHADVSNDGSDNRKF
ncbi:hypothetical protein U1Q18_003452 [Sarracenia purpurea var. burkii]